MGKPKQDSRVWLDQLLKDVPIEVVIGRYVPLTARFKGREYIGLCPWHTERTPSFTVVPYKGFYHCFGCGSHGNTVRFLQRIKHYSFSEAVIYLAEIGGMEIPKWYFKQVRKIMAEQGRIIKRG